MKLITKEEQQEIADILSVASGETLAAMIPMFLEKINQKLEGSIGQKGEVFNSSDSHFSELFKGKEDVFTKYSGEEIFKIWGEHIKTIKCNIGFEPYIPRPPKGTGYIFKVGEELEQLKIPLFKKSLLTTKIYVRIGPVEIGVEL